MSKPTYVTNYKAIENVLLNFYAKGNQEAQSSIMAPAFHDLATMYAVDDKGQLIGGPVQETLFKDIDEGFNPSTPEVAIAYIDIAGNAASARVDSDNADGFWFSDYFNLLKIEGEWKIVNKIFHTHHVEKD